MERFFYYQLEIKASETVRDQLYQVGTISVFDSESDSVDPVSCGEYSVPIEVASQFHDFVSQLETQLPLMIQMGDKPSCDKAAQDALTVSAEQLNEPLEQRYDQEEDYWPEDEERFGATPVDFDDLW